MSVEKAAGKVAEKDSNDLDAVAGNAEDDIGDLILGIREKELLYGEKSLLAVYGPMIASICAHPKRYRVSGVLFGVPQFSLSCDFPQFPLSPMSSNTRCQISSKDP